VETTNTITKVTGQTVVALPSCAVPLFGTRGIPAVAPRVGGLAVSADNGLGLNGLGVRAVSGSGFTGLGRTNDETGLSGDWAILGGGIALRDERPTQASKAVAVVAEHGRYAQASGAGAVKKQDEQLIDMAEAAFTGAEAVRMRAFRGPKPWSERT
jgi:hypothetical protein